MNIAIAGGRTSHPRPMAAIRKVEFFCYTTQVVAIIPLLQSIPASTISMNTSTSENNLQDTATPKPDILHRLSPGEQEQLRAYIDHIIREKTDGIEELYQAIAMIAKYIPRFVLIPLMVDHIRPAIAAGVCRHMGIEQSAGYANDLPLEYFSEVSKHLDDVTMAGVVGRMKKHQAEKFIHYELQHHLLHMFEIAEHLDERMLGIIARHVTLPEHSDDLLEHPHRELIRRIRDKQ